MTSTLWLCVSAASFLIWNLNGVGIEVAVSNTEVMAFGLQKSRIRFCRFHEGLQGNLSRFFVVYDVRFC